MKRLEHNYRQVPYIKNLITISINMFDNSMKSVPGLSYSWFGFRSGIFHLLCNIGVKVFKVCTWVSGVFCSVMLHVGVSAFFDITTVTAFLGD